MYVPSTAFFKSHYKSAFYEKIKNVNPDYLLFFFKTELKELIGQIVCTDKGILAVEMNKLLLPPTWNKTLAWGYADLSCRLGAYESDKVCISLAYVLGS